MLTLTPVQRDQASLRAFSADPVVSQPAVHQSVLASVPLSATPAALRVDSNPTLTLRTPDASLAAETSTLSFDPRGIYLPDGLSVPDQARYLYDRAYARDGLDLTRSEATQFAIDYLLYYGYAAPQQTLIEQANAAFEAAYSVSALDLSRDESEAFATQFLSLTGYFPDGLTLIEQAQAAFDAAYSTRGLDLSRSESEAFAAEFLSQRGYLFDGMSLFENAESCGQVALIP
ncbi:MAG: hypothetical protein AAFQ82_09730 [Myxococcota bacterium]